MKNLRRDFERFCYRHQNKGIPNLMLYVAIGTAVVYLFMIIDPSNLLYSFFRFDRAAFSTARSGGLSATFSSPVRSCSAGWTFCSGISLYFYYYIGRVIEGQWGTFRFNLFYFSGVLITDIAALLLNCTATVEHAI